jgi:hypothetical protein
MGPPPNLKNDLGVDTINEDVENSAPVSNQAFEVGACINVRPVKRI